MKALWPRAQIKLYGSHVTNLCLPSSDMDFVICLPAVHKNAPATAPGDLEGRNAINETNQKVLARKLKTESWLGKLEDSHCDHVSLSTLTLAGLMTQTNGQSRSSNEQQSLLSKSQQKTFVLEWCNWI